MAGGPGRNADPAASGWGGVSNGTGRRGAPPGDAVTRGGRGRRPRSRETRGRPRCAPSAGRSWRNRASAGREQHGNFML